MNPKNSKKSQIHENADANITCDFGDGDISRSRSFLSNTCTTGANGRRRHDGRRHDRRQSRGLLQFNSRLLNVALSRFLQTIRIRPKWEGLSSFHFIIDPGARFFVVRRVSNIEAGRHTRSGDHCRSSAVLKHRRYLG